MLEKERFLAIKKLAHDIREDNKKIFKSFSKLPFDEAVERKDEFINSVIDNMDIAFSDGEQGREEKQMFRANILIPNDKDFYENYSKDKNIRSLMNKYAVSIEDVMSKITELNIYGKYLEDVSPEEDSTSEPTFVDEMVKISPKEAESLLDEIDNLSSVMEDLDLELLSYPLASQNNNHNIYDFLRTNPSLSDVRKRFEASFDGWKKEFQNTPFENYVDKDVAMSYYPEGDRRLEDNFSDDILTFIFFNGSSGLILEKLMAMTKESKIEPLKSILTKKGRKELYQEEVYYLKSIRDYLLSLSDNSILTIGNFPYFNTPLGVFVNPIISEFNGEIRKAVEGEKTSFYEGMSLSFFEEYGGKIKVDNHPTIDEQYASLLGYAEHINEKVKVLTRVDEN